ncbi:MAG TPA: DnaJ domain-containing protein [Clostridia bacterium]
MFCKSLRYGFGNFFVFLEIGTDINNFKKRSDEMPDFYEIMCISRDASQEEIKKAYRKLAKKYHPDANPDDKNAEEKFKEINEAYATLSDEERKKAYDLRFDTGKSENRKTETHGKNGQKGNEPRQGYAPFNFEDVEKSFEQFFGFNPKTKEKVMKTKGEKKNPLDTSQAFENYFRPKKE